jgi:SAM-dependent methyltransferase
MHDSWAPYYDFVYDECFGAEFWRITSETLGVLTELQPVPGRILDLGAGTGRLAIPLALLGYHVSAVEISQGMARVLSRRAGDLGLDIDLHCGDLRALEQLALAPTTPVDLAAAIFTVVNYLITEDELWRLAAGVVRLLRPGGRFLFDIAERRLFAPALFESERLHREIDVRALSPVVFRYRDAGCGTIGAERFAYDEVFTLRYWRAEEVLATFARAGLTFGQEVTSRLQQTGSRWFVLESGGTS